MIVVHRIQASKVATLAALLFIAAPAKAQGPKGIYSGGESDHVVGRKFIALSLATYARAFLDIHESAGLGHELYEHDPLARPVVFLPRPELYLSGAAMVSGLNFVSWKMEHSRRFRKVWFVPQLASCIGNFYGYASTRARS